MIINEEMILGAVVKAIAPLTTIADHNRFAYEVSMVLNRFKTNLYLMMDEDDSKYDPNELINITITGGAEIINYGGSTVITRRDRTMLRVYGIRGVGATNFTQGLEFMVSKDISDMYPADRLIGMHNSHFLSRREEGVPSILTDTERFNLLDFVDASEHGCFFFSERQRTDDAGMAEMTISGRVNSKALERKRRETSERHPGSEGRYLQQPLAEKQRQLAEDKTNPAPAVNTGKAKRSYER